MFFDRTGPSPISDLLHFNGEVLKRFLVNSPSYPITEPELAVVPTSVVVLGPRQRIPYTLQYGVGVEQQLNARSTLFANYVGVRGIDMFRSIDANAPPPPDYIARPNSSLGQERTLQSEGYQEQCARSWLSRQTCQLFTGQTRCSQEDLQQYRWHHLFPANSYFRRRLESFRQRSTEQVRSAGNV